MSRLLSFLFSVPHSLFVFFFFNDTATTEIYTLSLHDALPISAARGAARATPARTARRTTPAASAGRRASTAPARARRAWVRCAPAAPAAAVARAGRSEEHTSELQSRSDLVCRLLLEKKKRRRHAAARSNRRPRARTLAHRGRGQPLLIPFSDQRHNTRCDPRPTTHVRRVCAVALQPCTSHIDRRRPLAYAPHAATRLLWCLAYRRGLGHPDVIVFLFGAHAFFFSYPCAVHSPFFFFLIIRPPPRSPLFPYTPLFR